MDQGQYGPEAVWTRGGAGGWWGVGRGQDGAVRAVWTRGSMDQGQYGPGAVWTRVSMDQERCGRLWVAAGWGRLRVTELGVEGGRVEG